MKAAEVAPLRWSMIVESFTRPYPVSIPMIVLVAVIPFYILIPSLTPGRKLHVPEVAWDRLIPVQPVHPFTSRTRSCRR